MHRFLGFPPQTFEFYAGLRENNRKEWFDERRGDYEKHVLDPARRFVEAMGQRLSLLIPHIHADPRVNRSLFRIYRDTRFSKDKTPYKTHLAVWFWEGRRPRMECSGFYLHLEPNKVMAGTGLYRFPKPHLQAFRRAAAQERSGRDLSKILQDVSQRGYGLGGGKYKRVPQGYGADHPRADLLLCRGIYSYIDSPSTEVAQSSGLLDWCFEHYLHSLPLHLWLHKHVVKKAR